MGTKAYDNFADLITFSRASGGTALRHVGYGDELVTNGTFDTDTSGWSANGSPLVSVVAGQARVQENGGSNPSIYQAFSTTIGSVYKVETFMDNASSAAVRVNAVDSASAFGTNWRILSSVRGSLQTNYIVATATTTYIHLLISAASGLGLVGFFDNISVKEVIFDRASDPLVLFNHPANIPRVEYAADGSRKGLLIEEARTNLVTYSQDFTNAAWTKTNAATLALDATGPDGVSNSAVTLVDNGAGGTSFVSVRVNSVTVLTNTPYTLSCFMKADQLTWGRLQLNNFTTASGQGAYFDLAGGAVGAVGSEITSANIEPYGDGWYRCSVTFTSDAVDTLGDILILPAEADGDVVLPLDGTSSILIYGAQFEAGAFPTSYIPTLSGSTVTRSADVASMPVSAFGYNPKAGTVVVDLNSFGDNTYQYAVALTPTSATGAFEISLRKSVSNWNYSVSDNSVVQASINEAFSAQAKLAGAYKANSFNASINGSVEVEDTSGTVPSGLVDLRIGRQTSFQLNGHIKSIAYYPRRLSNVQLQELTA